MDLKQIDVVTIHPIFNHFFSVSEHPEGELLHLGDALGCDCIIEKFVDGWMRSYKNDGSRNEDWYGWEAEVLAPFNSVIESSYINPITNIPGNINHTRASSIIFKSDNDVRVCFVHVKDVCVSVGDTVKAGDVIAKVGNDGYSRHPHIHIGAWKEKGPLQIRFDLKVMGQQLKALGEQYHI